MNQLKSSINPRSEEFLANAKHMQDQLDDLYTLVEHIKLGGGESRQARHRSRGKLLARDRIDHLLDEGSALTISPVAAFTNGGPAKKIVAWLRTIIDSSAMAGT